MRVGLVRVNVLNNQVVLIQSRSKHDGILELLAPAWVLLRQIELYQLLLLGFFFVVVITLADCDQADVFLGHFDTSRLWLVKLNFEDDIAFFFLALTVTPRAFSCCFACNHLLFNLGDLLIYKLYSYPSRRLIMPESELLVLRKVVFELDCTGRRSVLSQRLGADPAADSTITSVNTLDLNLNFFLILAYSDICRSESNCAWEILIQNRNFTPSIITWKSILFTWLLVWVILLWIVQLNPEFKIWIPLFIIYNGHFNLPLDISLGEVYHFIDVGVVLWRLSRVWYSSDAQSQFLVEDLLYNSDFDMAIALSYRIVLTFESNKLVFLFGLLIIIIMINLSF